VEKAQNAITKVKESVDAIIDDPTVSLVSGIRKVCNLVSDCFDETFGAGTGNKVLGGSCDMGKALDAFGQFATQIQTLQEQSVNAIISKYTPNRVARRKKK
jgi:hypothetical protein